MKKENLKKIFFALFLMLFVPAVQAGESSIGSENNDSANSTGSDNTPYTNNPGLNQNNTGSEKKKSFRDRVKEKGKNLANSAKEKGKKLANRARAAKDNINNAYRNRMEVRRRSKEAARETAKSVKAEQKNRNGTGSKV